MSEYNLNLKRLIERPERYFPRNELCTRLEDGSMFRYTYREMTARTRRLASALSTIGIGTLDKVATLSWNTHQHLELYFAVPCSGAVLHTANLRLSDEHLAYTINHAADKALFFSPDLLAQVESVAPLLKTVKHYVVIGDRVPETKLSPISAYEDLIAAGDPDFVYPEVDERAPASMCFTSATTGNPKGVVYSHRALYLHSQVLCNVDCCAVSERDALLPIAPMFHVNSWGVPFAGTWMGSRFIFPGQRPHAGDIVKLIAQEKATFAFGAVTVGIDMMNFLEHEKHDVSSLRAMMLGGSATPAAVMHYFEKHHGFPIYTAWGSTECAPIATAVCIKRDQQDLPADQKIAIRVRQGVPVAGVEMKVLDDDGKQIPWDDRAIGEVYVRGPWIATTYLNEPRSKESFIDGWWKSGDIASVNDDGVIKLVDRAKDLIKSGGEWISSVDLENTLMAHAGVREATVVGQPHEKWIERPIAFLVGDPKVPRPNDEALREHLAEHGIAKWWMPDRFIFLDALPKTGVGKFDKKYLRQHLDQYL
ncbi:MAG: long-chain fatty acid--CoA ligase [Gammaproteobacteria bacterium]|nr:long-chain fatty acid--CoA ligase [Gammaproteobacteria bacterium]